MEIIKIKEDFPVDGEAYITGKYKGRYFFAWGWEYTQADSELPMYDIPNSENGISWHKTKKEALAAFNEAAECWEVE